MNVAIVVKKAGEFQAIDSFEFLEVEAIKCEFNLFSNINEADYCVCWKQPPTTVNNSKIILFQTEPPIASNIKKTYNAFSKYAHVFCYQPKGINQSSITKDPLCYLYNPASNLQITRENTSMTGNGFYFAGKRKGKGGYFARIWRNRFPWQNIDQYNNRVIYSLRSEIALKMKGINPNSLILGKGFDQNTKSSNWRKNKYEDIELGQNDFMFCCENSIFENYISEKIHDGFNSDRVTCYLGEPNIEQYVPSDAYIDMREYISEKGFEKDKFDTFISSLDQHQYDAYLKAARKFRQKLKPRFLAEKKRITKDLMNVLKKSNET